jgi:ribonuclease G
MYSPGDAVAKVDGYMISITGAGDYVGEKHLVRIEEAGRTSAVATLLDAPAAPADDDSDSRPPSNGDGLESKPRRRGRRGGRRRSGAKAESVSSSE